MKEFLSKRENALKAAALHCVASGDIDIEKVRMALDMDMNEGLGEIDFDSEDSWTPEELKFKILTMKFKMLMSFLKKHRYGFIVLNDCRESKALDIKDAMKEMMMSEHDMMALNATAKLEAKLEHLETVAFKAAGFVYSHKSLLKMPDYCLEVAKKGMVLSKLSEKMAKKMMN